jgi:hypothetical protein
MVLGLEAGEPAEVDIHDVMGELVNIIGGNLKGMIGDAEVGWRLSLPLVSSSMQNAPGGRLVAEVSFLTDGGALGCQILEHS